jgi:lipopolysaccharide transport system permease protein
MDTEKWDSEITTKNKFFDLKLNEVFKYRDLIILLVRRDIVAYYTQTILGPIWFFIQPIFTTIIYTLIFGGLASISTDGLPKPLFYLVGIISWNYFASCFTKTSTTFKDNAVIFGKVYFPRLIVPLSIVLSNLFRFGIQILLLVILMIYYSFNGVELSIDMKILILPFLILLMALQGLGLGMIVTSITTKYNDLSHLVIFGIQLMMYATPVIYPLSSLSGNLYWIVALNPLTYIIEAIKYIIFGVGTFNAQTLLYSIIISFSLFYIGMLVFNKAEKTFIDTI